MKTTLYVCAVVLHLVGTILALPGLLIFDLGSYLKRKSEH